jgi:hypothetical protein
MVQELQIGGTGAWSAEAYNQGEFKGIGALA